MTLTPPLFNDDLGVCWRKVKVHRSIAMDMSKFALRYDGRFWQVVRFGKEIWMNEECNVVLLQTREFLLKQIRVLQDNG